MYIYLIKKLEQSQNAVEIGNVGRNIGKKEMVKNFSPFADCISENFNTKIQEIQMKFFFSKLRLNFTKICFSQVQLVNGIILIKTFGILKVIPGSALVFKNLLGHLQIVRILWV